MKKMLFLLISLVLLFSVSTQIVQASTLSTDETTKSSASNYISLKDAKLLALNTISLRAKHDNSCPWKSNFKFGEIITLYGLDDMPNAYAFNLVKNNKEAGYVLVEANINSPQVAGFSYDNKFYSEKMIEKNFKGDKKFNSMSNKIYFLSSYNLLIKNYEDRQEFFYNASSKVQIKTDKDTMKSQYIKLQQSKIDENAKTVLRQLKTNSLISNISSISLSHSNSVLRFFIVNIFFAYNNE